VNAPTDRHPDSRSTVLTVFGTRPEVIKLAPVVAELGRRPDRFRVVTVSSGQHPDLIAPFVQLFGLRVAHDLEVMRPGQPLSLLFARVLTALDPVLVAEKPAVVLVQGDTTTAAAAALAAFHRRIPVGHVEAGLRTADPLSPFPEEMNRRLVTRLARWHFAGTRNHVRTLLREGVARDRIVLTGNPVVDALQHIEAGGHCSPALRGILVATEGKRRIVLTTHRRESFGGVLEGNLRVLADFVERHPDTALIFPVHPNPVVREVARAVLAGRERVHLTEPLEYADFIGLLSRAWVIASDSGGVQEEAPSLGVPLLVLRETTERPEALECGAARLAKSPELLATMLAELDRCYPTAEAGARPDSPRNPFGDGRAGRRIVRALARLLDAEPAEAHP
jgi:UDP-N-acetylglucosamine 2-epimerase (non-hydrolysing)